MPDLHTFAAFAAMALLMALSPGPNMVYLISRTLCQGKAAGLLSWYGVVLGFTVHMTSAAFGLTALFMAVPLAYELLRCGWPGSTSSPVLFRPLSPARCRRSRRGGCSRWAC
jgi:threonine/homoserine/homoserine lactone efflux protein